MSEYRNEGFDFSKIIIVAIVLYCIFKMGECEKHEVARDIMNDSEFRRENNIRTYEEAEEKAEEMIEQESDNRAGRY